MRIINKVKNISILIRLFRYFEKRKKFKIEKINSKLIGTEYAVICILILIILVHLYLRKNFKSTLILILILNVIYNNIYIFLINKNIKKYIDDKFNERSEAINIKRKEFLKTKSKINRLIVLDEFGNDKKVFEFSKLEYVIGKSSVNNVVDIDLNGFLNDSYVSRRHARIFCENEIYYITDEGSKNGTDILKLNNRRINLRSFKKEKIVVGDTIIIKDIKILVN